MDPQKVQIEESWRKALSEEFQKPYFDKIVAFLKKEYAAGKDIYPPGKLIFNAFNTCPFSEVKVIILGQDPYHGPGQAMGLSFSVPKAAKIPPSLRNIYKEIHHDIGTPIPKHGDLSSWAEQGVFLLNSVLTVEHKLAGSHKKIGWQKFTDAVIQKLSEEREALVFMLWGNYARSKKNLIDDKKHLLLQSYHPSPLAGNGFFNNHHFSKANAFLTEHGLKPINWTVD